MTEEMQETQVFRKHADELREMYDEALKQISALKGSLIERGEYITDTERRYKQLKEDYDKLEAKWKIFDKLFGTAKEKMSKK